MVDVRLTRLCGTAAPPLTTPVTVAPLEVVAPNRVRAEARERDTDENEDEDD
jgi:hypothetical protein